MSSIGKAVTIRDLIDQMAALQVGHPFLIRSETGRVLSYDGLQRQLLHIFGFFVNWACRWRQNRLAYG